MCWQKSVRPFYSESPSVVWSKTDAEGTCTEVLIKMHTNHTTHFIANWPSATWWTSSFYLQQSGKVQLYTFSLHVHSIYTDISFIDALAFRDCKYWKNIASLPLILFTDSTANMTKKCRIFFSGGIHWSTLLGYMMSGEVLSPH